MNTIALRCSIRPNKEENRQVVIAALEQLGYEGFIETETGIIGYIPEQHYNRQALDDCSVLKALEAEVHYTAEKIEEKDWNRVWEDNYFKPLIIRQQCIIRSSFHKNTPNLPYEIVINPRMAFGTGHHETTRLMIEQILRLDLRNKTVLDMGTGTGVLAILSSMRGAKEVVAVDVDEWAYRNALENIEMNRQSGIEVLRGDSKVIPNKLYDVMLANINLTVIRNDISLYAKMLQSGGYLLLSGFYEEALNILSPILHQNYLQINNQRQLNSWCVVECYKQ